MSQFEYLSVLISIIIGLAITQLLSGAARLIQIRGRVRPHATTLCWMVTLFLLDTQIWWAAFFRRWMHEWNFFLFLLYLLMPILAFVLSYLVLPELGDEDEIDLAANFAGNTPWFFGLMSLLLVVSLAEEFSRSGRLPTAENLAFQLLFLAVSAVSACTRSARFHRWAAIVALVLICCYIAMLFMHLH
jgi:hypothetical protein